MPKLKSRINEVYRVKNHSPATYIQLVSIDQVQMNSDVVVVFEDGADEIKMYMHTLVDKGVQDGLWTREDKQPIDVDLKDLKFKTFVEDYLDEGHGPYWNIWTAADKDWKQLSLSEGKSFNAIEGGIYPATDLIFRLKHCESEFKSGWPPWGWGSSKGSQNS